MTRRSGPGRHDRAWLRFPVVAIAVICALMISGAGASSEPPGRQFDIAVYSPAMGRSIPLRILRPADSAPHPTLYLLNAVDGGEGAASWTDRTDAAAFFADKNVNVVIPLGGRASYYTDWRFDDPALGRNQWATFLTAELPPIINSMFATTGRNAVAGLSMSATSALDLAIQAPGLYQAVGSFSGCAQTSGPLAQAYVSSQLLGFGANPINMWGPPTDPAWAAHDPTLNAERLRGTALVISAGSGLPGPHETLDSPGINGNVGALIDRIGVGGVMESVVDQCTRQLTDRLGQLGIPAVVDFRPTGTHAWAYWQDDLHESWPLIGSAIGA